VTLSAYYQSIQFVAWLVALIEFVFGLYVLVLNARHNANRHTSVLLLASAACTFATGWMLGATNPGQAFMPAVTLAFVLPAIQPLYLLGTIAIARNEWQRSRGRWIWWLFYLIALAPAIATVIDLGSGSSYWYSDLPQGYTGGFIPFSAYTAGSLSTIFLVLNFFVTSGLVILLLLFFMLFDKRISPANRRLSWPLLVAEVLATGIYLAGPQQFLPAVVLLIPIALLAFTAAFVAIQQIIVERRAQYGSIHVRLTALIAVVTIPLLVAISVFISWRVGALLDLQSQRELSVTLGAGSLLILILSWLTIRQALQPVAELTSTAASIASGDLTRVATVQSEDEVGKLARAFNSMTTQLRESITNLERRVVERTRDLERRAVQLEVAAEVARQAAAIRDLRQLMDHTVRLISERFNFYHAGIFLIDESGKFAVLRAASSEGGQKMLARGHKLAVGQVGIVGYVAGKGEPRIALDVGADATYFNNPDLPQTRSEMALPLKIKDNIIGILDVQSTKAAAFAEEDLAILQVLADQIALAIENAKLISESQEVISELGALYQQQVRKSWQMRLEDRDITYVYRQGKVSKDNYQARMEDEADNDPHVLKLPVILRGQSLGWISLRRNPEAQPWAAEEAELAKSTINQLALALENARLMEENRQRAQEEELLGTVSAKTQGLLDVESVLKIAVQEIGRSMGLAKVQIQLGNGEVSPALSHDQNEPV
jgi:GAF domain-containing protein/HAMP domain-containing protein